MHFKKTKIERGIFLILCALFLATISARGQQDISIEMIGAKGVSAEATGRIKIIVNNNSDALSFGGKNTPASINIDFDRGHIDVAEAATGKQDNLPAGWKVASVTQNETTCRIVISMGSDVIRPLGSRSFMVKFKTKNTFTWGVKVAAKIIYANGMPPKGNSTENDTAAASITGL